ncbi:MAG: NAD(P)-dependent oxidoreductase [Desulfuromonadales bacterium]|nr:NAD(P)-dependent oxidoreductase [Desulfuromonadales bacterium]
MNILLTGATGYLGSHLARAFLSAGHSVTILKRSFSDLRRLTDVQSSLRMFDLDRNGLEEAFQSASFNAVVHTATCYGRAGEQSWQIFETNAAWPLRLMEMAATAGTGMFMNTDTSLDRYLNFYSLSKKQFSEWGKMFAAQGRIRYVNIELEHFFGPGDDDSKFITHVIKSCVENVPEFRLTAGEQKRDFIYIDDVVAAYTLLLEKAPSLEASFQEYGLGSGEAVTIREVVERVHHLTGSGTILNFGALPYRANEVMESRADISSLTALGWAREVDLIEGLRKTVEIEALKMKGTH